MGFFHHDCDECKPGGRHQSPLAIVISSSPFLASFLSLVVIFLHTTRAYGFVQPKVALPKSRGLFGSLARIDTQQWVAFISSFTLALSATLVEVILCEILGLFGAGARKLVFRITIWLLLSLLMVVIPFLEIRSLFSGRSGKASSDSVAKFRLRLVFQVVALGAWLVAFLWTSDKLIGRQTSRAAADARSNVTQFSLERVGILGISSMALLSGFASVSAPWQLFFVRLPEVTETDLARKEAGLTATNDMLSAKLSRYRALERKLLDRPKDSSFFSRAVSSFRPSAEHTELKSLEMEISGLETMSSSLRSAYDQLKFRWNQQSRAGTPTGRVIHTTMHGFALFCIYRVFTTAFTFFRRLIDSPVPQSDPINSLLSLLARHFDPSINQETWSRALTFLFSGVILSASFSSVLQTFALVSRYVPVLLRAVQSNLPLIAAQLSGFYVLSAVLMLKGLMPKDLLRDSLNGLGGGTQQWVDRWFEVCFLVGVVITTTGIWISRKLKEDDDWETDIEGGKRS